MPRMRWFAGVVAILILAVLWVSPQSGAPTSSIVSSRAWPPLIAAMEHMHTAIAPIGSSGDDDTDFVQLMLPHHQAALDMAKAELLHGKDPQVRRLAQEIITDQQSEIELMQLWLKHRATTGKNVLQKKG